tara:strand:+ start:6077 stop:6244 length:168 start_codon:yes stop_codon:yes gene_type:complete
MRHETLVDKALTELENAMDALHKLNQNNVVNGFDYQKINTAIWDIEQVLKEWKEE